MNENARRLVKKAAQQQLEELREELLFGLRNKDSEFSFVGWERETITRGMLPEEMVERYTTKLVDRITEIRDLIKAINEIDPVEPSV